MRKTSLHVQVVTHDYEHWNFSSAALKESRVPDMSSHAASACEKGKHWQEPHCLLKEMLHRLLAPNVVSHSAAISACEKGKHWEEALGLLQEMLRRSLTPKVVSRSAAISACEKGKHWE